MNKKTILKDVNHETTTISDRFDYLSLYYFFEILKDKKNDIHLKTKVISKDQEDENIFILNKETAMRLGQELIYYANKAYEEQSITNNLNIQALKLYKFITLGYIKDIYVYKTKNNTPYSEYDKTNHVYNIRPIFKHGIQSKYFNFSICCSIGFYNNYEDRVKALCEVLLIDYDIIKENNIKIRFRNLTKSFIKDQEYTKEIIEKQQEKLKEEKESLLKEIDNRIKNGKSPIQKLDQETKNLIDNFLKENKKI